MSGESETSTHYLHLTCLRPRSPRSLTHSLASRLVSECAALPLLLKALAGCCCVRLAPSLCDDLLSVCCCVCFSLCVGVCGSCAFFWGVCCRVCFDCLPACWLCCLFLLRLFFTVRRYVCAVGCERCVLYGCLNVYGALAGVAVTTACLLGWASCSRSLSTKSGAQPGKDLKKLFAKVRACVVAFCGIQYLFIYR